MFEEVYTFADKCSSYVQPFKISQDGYLHILDFICEPTTWAKQQICKAAGCTPKFFDVLKDFNDCYVFNNVLGEREFLFKIVQEGPITNVRAFLSKRYNREVTNVWVVENVIQRVNFVKVLSASEVTFSLTKFDYDYLAIRVRSGDAALLVLNSETGRAALSCLLQIRVGKSFLTTPVLRKIHTGIDITVAEETLTKAVTTTVTKINSILPTSLNIKIKLRPFDLKLFPYPKPIKSFLFESARVKEEGLIEVSLKEIVERIPNIEDFRWQLIVSCDLFNVCSLPSTYIKEGWLIKWPVRTNWLA